MLCLTAAISILSSFSLTDSCGLDVEEPAAVEVVVPVVVLVVGLPAVEVVVPVVVLVVGLPAVEVVVPVVVLVVGLPGVEVVVPVVVLVVGLPGVEVVGVELVAVVNGRFTTAWPCSFTPTHSSVHLTSPSFGK